MRYRVLGPSGIRVGELALGTMTFGTAWEWGADKAECGRMLDAFVEAGGNFVDTACNYTDCESETIVGELLAAVVTASSSRQSTRSPWIAATPTLAATTARACGAL